MATVAPTPIMKRALTAAVACSGVFALGTAHADGLKDTIAYPTPSEVSSAKPDPGVDAAARPDCAKTAWNTYGVAPEADPLGYVPVEPTRILDTRIGLGTPNACRVAPNKHIAVQVAGRGQVPAEGVAAAVINVTGTDADGLAWVAAYAAGMPFPGTSSVNVSDTDDGAALVIVPVSPKGNINIAGGGEDLDVVVDVVGYFPKDGSGSKFTAIGAKRVLDTQQKAFTWERFSSGLNNPDAVVANAILDRPRGDSYMTLVDSQFQTWGAQTSNLNVGSGLTRANRSFVTGGAQMSAFSLRDTRSVVDVTGYFGAEGDGFVPLDPKRIIDTRIGLGAPKQKISAGTTSFNVMNSSGIPQGATSIVATVTAVDGERAGYLTVFPSDAPRPPTSDINMNSWDARANLVIVPIGKDGTINTFLNSGRSNVIVDVLGYFRGETLGPDAVAPEELKTTFAGGLSGGAVTDAKDVTFSAEANGAGSYECNLDWTGWTACEATHTLKNLAPGDHHFEMRALNAAGEPDPNPAAAEFRVAGDIGAVKPGKLTTGVPRGTVLKKHVGNLYITEPGTVIDGMDIEGFVRVKAPNVTIKRSIIRGPKEPKNPFGLIMNYDASAVNTRVEDVTLLPSHPTPYHEGLKGMNIHAERVDISGVVDGAGFHGDNTSITNSWIHNLLMYTSGNYPGAKIPTHNDGIQIHGGRNHVFRGNWIGDGNNAAMQVGPDAGAINDVKMIGNWLDDGGCTVNMHDKGKGPMSGMVVANNVFTKTSRVSNCPIIATTDINLSAYGNTYAEDGTEARVRNGG